MATSRTIEGISKCIFMPQSMYAQMESQLKKLQSENDRLSGNHDEQKAADMVGAGPGQSDLPKPATGLIIMNDNAPADADPVTSKEMDSNSVLAGGYRPDLVYSSPQQVLAATKSLAKSEGVSMPSTSGSGPSTTEQGHHAKTPSAKGASHNEGKWYFLGPQESDDGETTDDE